MSNTIHDVLSRDERIIVLSDESEGTFYTWNQSVTLQVWNAETFEEISIRTLGGGEPKDFREAREAAIRWRNDGWNDDR